MFVGVYPQTQNNEVIIRGMVVSRNLQKCILIFHNGITVTLHVVNTLIIPHRHNYGRAMFLQDVKRH